MSPFTANLPSLQEIVDEALRFERVASERLDEMDSRARRVRSAWSGAAADEYEVAHARWSAGAQSMHAALGLLRRVVETAHGNYAQAVSANRAMWP